MRLADVSFFKRMVGPDISGLTIRMKVHRMLVEVI